MISTPNTSRRIRSERSAEPIPFTGAPATGLGDLVSLRAFKAAAERFKPDHPLRILLAGEPDEIPRDEYVSKVLGWYRLARTPVD